MSNKHRVEGYIGPQTFERMKKLTAKLDCSSSMLIGAMINRYYEEIFPEENDTGTNTGTNTGTQENSTGTIPVRPPTEVPVRQQPKENTQETRTGTVIPVSQYVYKQRPRYDEDGLFVKHEDDDEDITAT